jgi:hypothetical protein
MSAGLLGLDFVGDVGVDGDDFVVDLVEEEEELPRVAGAPGGLPAVATPDSPLSAEDGGVTGAVAAGAAEATS